MPVLPSTPPGAHVSNSSVDDRKARSRPMTSSGLARGRLLLLSGGGLGLLVGIWTGLARAGVHQAIGPVMEHGILMVLGFLGTLIALERAVALRSAWAYAAPALAGAAVVWLLLGWDALGAGILLTIAGAVVTAVYLVILRRRYETHLALMAVGAVAWVVAAALWTWGWSPVALAPMLAAFPVFTVLGERLELSRLRMPSAASRRRLCLAAAVFGVGVAVTLAHRWSGLVIGGVGLLAQTLWFARNDIARATIRRPGLPRFAAACMLLGYLWLGASGALWIALGLRLENPLLYDAALHALFLGFVISMVMGHTSIILPAVLRVRLPHRPVAWLPLALLHVTVASRVVADLLGSGAGRGWSAHGNSTALLLFVGIAVWTAARETRGVTASSAPSTG